MENKNTLAKISIGINVILVIAVIILFVKMPSAASTGADAESDSLSTTVDIDKNQRLNIAYYSSDSLSTQSDFVKELQKEIQTSNQKAENKMKNKEREIQAWQKKWESKGGNLLPREMQQYQEEAAQKQQEIAIFEQSLQMEVAQEQEQLMMTMYQRIRNYAQTFSEKNEIDILISYQLGQNITYCNPKLDVTKQFINHANKEFNGTFEGDKENTEAEEGEE
ncbi:MAG: OmpH family outer membrane protein [Crocinitomicaceae bacterium]